MLIFSLEQPTAPHVRHIQTSLLTSQKHVHVDGLETLACTSEMSKKVWVHFLKAKPREIFLVARFVGPSFLGRFERFCPFRVVDRFFTPALPRLDLLLERSAFIAVFFRSFACRIRLLRRVAVVDIPKIVDISTVSVAQILMVGSTTFFSNVCVV